MKQENAVPDRAATFVVHPTPGIGDATTIQDALDMLPAAGGSIFVREGTYSISTTITPPITKAVTIFGCGNSTIIDLGANAIAAFTIATGYTTNTPIVFSNFKVTGTEVATQTVLNYAEANSLAEIYIDHMTTTGVELTINVTASATASATPGQDDARFHISYCRIRPNATNNSVILHNPSIGLPRAWLTEVEFMGDSLFAIPGGRTAPLFGRLADTTWFGDCYLDSCELSVGTGENDFATFESVDSTVWNNDNVNILIVFGLNGSFEGLSAGTVASSSFRGINFQAFENNNFESNFLQDTTLTLFGAGTAVTDNQLIGVATSGIVTSGFVVQTNNNNMVIHGNRFKFSQTNIGAIIDLEAPCTVTDNDLSEMTSTAGPVTSGSIFIDNGDCIITGNRFVFAPQSGRSLVEHNGPNYYDNNVQLFTSQTNSGGVIKDPIFPTGNGSTIQGMLDFNGAGSIGSGGTNLIVWYRNPYGLAKVQGYVQNTGGLSGNVFSVTEAYGTQNQGSFSRITSGVVSGQAVTLDPYNFTGFASGQPLNQVVDYRASIAATGGSIAWHTYFAAPDGVVGT